MRIGIVVEYLTARGGTSRFALEWAREARRRGHEILLVTAFLDRQRCYPHLLQGLDIIAAREVTSPLNGPAKTTPSRLRRAARTAGLHFPIAARALVTQTRLLADLIRPHVMALDVLNPHDYGPAMWGSVLAAEEGVPVVWQCNDPIAKWNDETPGLIGTIRRIAHAPGRRMLQTMERRFARRVTETLVLDSRAAAAVQRSYGTAARVLRGALDCGPFEAARTAARRSEIRRSLGIPLDAVLFLCVALPQPWRRIEDAVRAHALLENTSAWLYVAAPFGTDEYERTISQAIAESRAGQRILRRTTPFQSERELLDLYSAADVFLSPNTQQTWGLAVLEAAAAGLSPVVSRGAGVTEVLTDGVDALLHEERDVGAIAASMRRLIDDEGLRQELAFNARATARRYDWNRYAIGFEQAADDALLRVRGPR